MTGNPKGQLQKVDILKMERTIFSEKGLYYCKKRKGECKNEVVNLFQNLYITRIKNLVVGLIVFI